MAADTPAAPQQKPAPARSIPEIEADIEASRNNLINTVGQLQVAVEQTFNPRRILTVQIARVRSVYVDEYGGVRPERVAMTVGVVVSIVVLRRVVKRASKS